ncbi:MAG: 3-dehydroquinate dehydratase [Flavobacteriales bacterium]|nr:3-dehydroquinate dehydratase [Flavobacteriales bacterium]
MKHTVHIVNGPNLNLLGQREPEKYGHTSFESYLEVLRTQFPEIGLTYFQSNVEGELIDHLHAVGFGDGGVVLNAGGYTHTSVALRDAVASIQAAVMEVHITNVHAREEFRHVSLLSPVCKGVICGLGLGGYEAAIRALVSG